MEAVTPTTVLSIDEVVKLGALDTEFYAKHFFPRAFRQESPPFARDIWEPWENPKVRLANAIIFRGGSKTTRLRVFTSKRVAYGLSRTILFVGASERDAIRSVVWLRNQIDRNRKWADAFKLKRGSKWDETQIEILHEGIPVAKGEPPFTISVIAAGMTGSVRGVNFDDYRPDLIVVDDPQTDESAASEEQRKKVIDLVMNTLRNGLASRIDEPNAKLVMAVTPQHKDDVSQCALRDPEWTSVVFPCWTQATMNLPVDQQESSWPTLFPTADLRAQKRGAMLRNDLSGFTREMECRIVSREQAQFRVPWLHIRAPGVLPPRGGFNVLGIDPVPPPSERQQSKGLTGKDFEAHYVWGRYNGKYHLLDFDRSRGHDPSWSVATAFRLMKQWRCSVCVFDAVAYQRTLKWIFEKEMQRRGIYFIIIPVADGMKKFARITGTIGGLAQHGLLEIGPEATEFATQFEEYGPAYSGHDDDLDASALALQHLSQPHLEDAEASLDLAIRGDSGVEDFPMQRWCP